MFGIFGKKKKVSKTSNEGIDMDSVKVWYEGEVICGDYNLNNPSEYPFHNLFPHGEGKIIYSIDELVVEQYDGQFEAGQYQGSGVLIDRYGEILEGKFKDNLYLG